MAESLYQKYIDGRVLTRLRAQTFQSRLPMEGSVSGHHRSPHRGSSVEFAEYRTYVPGDDPRRIDWRVLARTDRFYLKEFEAETNLRAFFILDTSGSMGFSEGGDSKLDHARRMIATLAYLILAQGDAVGLHLVGRTTRELPARRSPGHLTDLLTVLDQARASGETGLVEGLHQTAERIPRRCQVLIFSDGFTDPEALLACFQHFRFRRHDVSVFHLLARQEIEFQFDRPIRFQDLESSHGIVTDPNLIRAAYLKEFNRFLDTLRKGCLEHQVDYRLTRLDQPHDKILADFLVARAAAGVPR